MAIEASAPLDSGTLEYLSTLECHNRLLELVGPASAARLSSASSTYCCLSPHAEAFWRSLCIAANDSDDDELDELHSNSRAEASNGLPASSVSWRVRFARVGGPGLARDGRKERLEIALAERGLALRSDSRLCKHYIMTGCSVIAGGLAEIVDTMEAMDFFHVKTPYTDIMQSIRERAQLQAETDATEAFLAGEEDRIDVARYTEQVNHDRYSELAKEQALRHYILQAALGEGGFCLMVAGVSDLHHLHDSVRELLCMESVMCAPCSLRHRLQALYVHVNEHLSSGSLRDWCFSFTLPCPPDERGAERRARLRDQSGVARARLEDSLATHVDDIRRLAQSSDDLRVIELPPTLSREDRAFLHQLAETLELQHFSINRVVPGGVDRILQIGRRVDLDLEEV